MPVLLPSLLAQDYPNLDIIILNDHSTDSTQ
ncbi:MAG: glycosyltransferase, partial [Deinococcales bacterium]